MNYSESMLKLNNFIKCYDVPYLEATTSSDLENCSGGDTYFVGLASTSSENIKIGAYGGEEIFEETTSLSTAKYDRYGSYWFHLKEKCFGFSETPNIEILSTDPTARGSDNRLCWRIGAYSSQNIAECRMLKYESEVYRKVIYVRRSPNSIDISDGNRINDKCSIFFQPMFELHFQLLLQYHCRILQ